MPSQPHTPLSAGPAPDAAAIFLDFDGVLVDLAERPDAITVPDTLGPLLRRLEAATHGATAIVTGRAIDDIRTYLDQPPAWLAGCHGGERAMPGQPDAPHPLTGSSAVQDIQRQVGALAAFGDGVVTEMKPLGAVVHYRNAPALEAALADAAHAIAVSQAGFEAHRAKMAFELKPQDVGKERVVADWMDRTPFAGRTPIYFGDDLTDELAMGWVQSTGGIAVKVGAGDTVAAHRVDHPGDVLAALSAWLEASNTPV
ncbi:MAG: trehalose-phosphatase [Pseudomonadota bacterium]